MKGVIMGDEELNKLALEMVADMKSAGGVLSSIDVKSLKEAFKKDDGPQGFLGIPGFFRRMMAGADAIHAVISAVVDKVEEIAADIKMAGAEKREVAIRVINLLVDIPYAPENVEAYIFGYTIDTIIRELNNRLGKDWLSKVSI